MTKAMLLTTENNKNLNLIKSELVSAWAYLITYVELFDHHDPKRMELFLETAPGFFGLIQSSLLEAVFIRLARLMDPADSSRDGTKPNLSFHRLFLDDYPNAAKKFVLVKNDWIGGNFESLQTYRNKILAHNDLNVAMETTPQVSAKLESQDVTKLRRLFTELWDVLVAAYFEKDKIAMLEPNFESLDMLPAKILKELKWSLYQSSLIDADIESGQFDDTNFQKFKFTNVGEDKPLRLIGNDLCD